MANTMNVRNFILEEGSSTLDSSSLPVQAAKTYRYEVEENGPDFVIHKFQTVNGKETLLRSLVCIPTKGQVYFLKGKNPQKPTARSLAGWFKDWPDPQGHIRAGWIRQVPSETALAELFLACMQDEEALSWIRRGMALFAPDMDRGCRTRHVNACSFKVDPALVRAVFEVVQQYAGRERAATFFFNTCIFGRLPLHLEGNPEPEEVKAVSWLAADSLFFCAILYTLYGKEKMQTFIRAGIENPNLEKNTMAPGPEALFFLLKEVCTPDVNGTRNPYYTQNRLARELSGSSYGNVSDMIADMSELEACLRGCGITAKHSRGCGFDALLEYVYYERIRQGYADDPWHFWQEWIDTLDMQKLVKGRIYDKYPKNLAGDHRLLSWKTRLLQQEIDEKIFQQQVERTSSNAWKQKGWLIAPPTCKDDILEEARQQSNCLASYVKAFQKGASDIYFMRRAEDPEKSVVTIEVRGGSLNQALGACNRRATNEEMGVVLEWCQKFGIHVPPHFDRGHVAAAPM